MLSPLQKRLLVMLDFFHRFCVENNIRYYVAGGTMLGAARHQGFIPWDDDVDVILPRKDYERLCALLENQVGNYVVETPYSKSNDYLHSFAKMYDTTTTMVEHSNKDVKRGVYIDIFPLDGLGNNMEESLKNYRPIDRLNVFLATRICAIRKERSFYKNVAIVASRLIPAFMVNEKKLFQKVDKMCASRDYDACAYIANCMSTYRQTEIIEKKLIGKPQEYKFENIVVFGPEKYNELLTHIYGNWCQLSPVEKRKPAHDFKQLDFNKSYF